MDVQVVSSQGQNSGVKTGGAFLPRILLSGFLLVSVIGDSAFPGLQTSVRRGTSLVYSALLHRGAITAAAPASGVVLGTCVGPPNLGQKGSQPCLLCSESCRAEVSPATRVSLATRVTPPLGIFRSVSDQNLSESVASSSSLCFH